MDTASIGNAFVEVINNVTKNTEAGAKNGGTIWTFISSPRFYLTLVVIVVGIGLWILLKKLSHRYNESLSNSKISQKAQSQRKTISHIMTSVFKVIIVVGGIIAFLQIQGVNVTTLVAGVSIITAIIGFALQDAIKDVVCGMYILADHYFEVGEAIAYEGEEGEVIRMSIRSTKIKSLINGNTITISNRNFSEAVKLGDFWDIDLGLSYEEDPRRIHLLLAEIAEKITQIKGIKKCEYKGTNEFAASAVIYKLRCYSSPLKKYDLKRASLRLIQNRLNDEGIHIPYNYLNVVVTEDKRKDTETMKVALPREAESSDIVDAEMTSAVDESEVTEE